MGGVKLPYETGFKHYIPMSFIHMHCFYCVGLMSYNFLYINFKS